MGADAVHPTNQTLSSYALGKLDDASGKSVLKHLEVCSECRLKLADVSRDALLSAPRGARAGPGLAPPEGSLLAGVLRLRSESSSGDTPASSTLPSGLAAHPDYEVLRELGRGGMGVVYLAENKLMGRKEVLKVVSAILINRPTVLDRFLREIRSAAKLHHTNIVTAYSALRFGEDLALAMEYVEGLDLADMVKAKGPLPVAHACNFVYQAALGLQHAHEHGMVHRDIKPSNLMLAHDGRKALVKVLDFGLAKVTSEGQADSGLTREGQMLGTPDYIAPEQIRDAQSADIRADVYSLGCTLYYLLAGRPPFSGDNLWDLYQAHFSMDAGPLNLIRPEIPVELAAMVAKMMAKDPESRFQEPKGVAQALSPFFKKENVAFKDPGTVALRDNQLTAARPENKAVSTLAQPPTESGGQAIQTKPAVARTVREVQWDSLIEFREAESSIEETPVVAQAGRPSWVWPSVAVGVFLTSLLAVWLSGVFEHKAPEEVKALASVPKDSEPRAVPFDRKPFNNSTGESHFDREGGSNISSLPASPNEPVESSDAVVNERSKNQAADDANWGKSDWKGAITESPNIGAASPRPKKRLLAITESAAIVHAVSKRDHGQLSLVERVLQGLGSIGGFEVVPSQDSKESITGEGLRDFDAVFFYTTGELPITPGGKEALLDFVRSGKGFAASHCAADTLYKWPEYGDLIGAYFGKRLGNKDVWVRLDDSGHPSTWDLDSLFKVREEIYQFRTPFTRDKPHILMHLDNSRISSQGAMAWTKAFGKGRVFYTALGHDEVIWRDERFRKHLLGGLCDVLGLEMPAGEIASPNGSRSAPAALGVELLRAGDSVKGAAMWSYTTENPGPKWAQLDFDDSSWPRSLMGFGTPITPAIRVATPWNTQVIWLRNKFNVPALAAEDELTFHMFYDEDVRVFVNGGLVFHGPYWVTEYRDVPLDQARRALFCPGENTIAVNCRQTFGGQGVDVGLRLIKRNSTPRPGDMDRRAAEAVLSLGGAVTIRRAEREEDIRPGDGLPPATFKLVRVRLVDRPELVDAGLEPLRGLTNVVEVNLANAKNVTDAGLERLQGLRQLEVLGLNETRVTDSGLVHLHALTKLRQLNLWRTQLTNPGLLNLQGLTQLESLNLGATHVTGAGLVHLEKLTNLRSLILWDQHVTDADLAHLKGLGELESLYLVGMPVTDAGLAHLKGLTKLRQLSLYNTQVTGAGLADPQALAQVYSLSLRGAPANDAGLAHLRNLPQLERLDLANTNLTDAGLAGLRGLSRLKHLDLTSTKVTAEGAEALKKALPACQLIADPAAVEKRPGSPTSRAPTNREAMAVRETGRGDFVPLFNGKDLTGWNKVPNHGGDWWVNEAGILEGKGGGDPGFHTFLVSDERRSFKNCVLRVTYCFPQSPGGRFVIRHSGSDDVMTGYQIQGFSSGRYPIGRIGRATVAETSMGDEAVKVPFADDQWHTIEISAFNNQIGTSMQETGALDFRADADAMYTSGRIAVMCFARSQIQIKEIWIKELPDDSSPKKSSRRKGSKVKN